MLEPETILRELCDVFPDVDPDLEAISNVDELDAAVDEYRVTSAGGHSQPLTYAT